MTRSIDLLVGDVVAGTEQLAAQAFAVASAIETSVRDRLGDEPARGRAWLDGVEGVTTSAVTAPDSPIQGAGFVVAVGLLPDRPWWLEWFLRESDGGVGRLEVQTDPDAMGFHDYEALPWYAIPKATEQRHVTGPYVDNLCTEDYTLTFTQPVLVDDTFMGVAGADIAVRRVELALLPAMRSVTDPIALVNADGRVLVSNTGALVCGELLGKPLADHRAQAVPGLPLSVVHLP